MITDSEGKISFLQYRWVYKPFLKAISRTSSREPIQNELSSILEDFYLIMLYLDIFLNLQIFVYILRSHVLFLWVFWVHEYVFLCVCMWFLCFFFFFWFGFVLFCSLFSLIYFIIWYLFAFNESNKKGCKLGSEGMWEDLDLGKVNGGKTIINIFHEINLFSS